MSDDLSSLPPKTTLIVVDYPGRRPEGHIADLGLDAPWLRVDFALVHPFAVDVSVAAFVKQMVANIRLSNSSAISVAAYCMAAPLAQELVAFLSNLGYRVNSLVFLDGVPGRYEAVAEAVRNALEDIAGHRISLEKWRDISLDEYQLRLRPAAFFATVRDAIVGCARAELLSEGDDQNSAEIGAIEATKGYLEWIGYLSASYRCSFPPIDSEMIHLVSRDHELIESWPGAKSTRLVKIDCDRASLLQARQTKDAVYAVIAPSGYPDLAR
ncbi:hypothetical protein [Mycobacteroides abscessus]|uniref:hypothetical protein n=1 Tax=Mycobacteroides abscessus TaxID=36809 RepID=UPI000C267518|nr:hypothetical protein [Mycobacteroides abscessus]